MTWQALAESVSEAAELVQLPGKIADTVDAQFLPMSCVTCAVNELGTFLDPNDQKLVDVLTDLWDGQAESWQHKTKTQGATTIENPWVNIVSATTPAWLRKNVPDTLIGGGLTSRIIFAYASEKHQLIAHPSDVVPREDYEEVERGLVYDLKQIAELCGEYEITPEAKHWVKNWYEELWDITKRPKHLASERFGGYIARKQTHLYKIAMVIAASERNELAILESDVKRANETLTMVEKDMLKVFQTIGTSEENTRVVELLHYIRALGPISQTKLFQHCMRSMTSKEFSEAIDAGIKANFLKLHNNGYATVVSLTEEAYEAL